MRLLVVYCHPLPDSFCAAIRDRVLQSAEQAGHRAQLLDLYAEGFDPVMGADERRNYHTPGLNLQPEPIARHLELLKWCEGLIYVYPTWWSGQPAMLKGWWDRIWVPYATFVMPGEERFMKPGLTNIRLLGSITTHGAPWWAWNLLQGAPGRRSVLQGARATVSRRCKRFSLELHNMDSVSARKRVAFLDKVEKRISRLH